MKNGGRLEMLKPVHSADRLQVFPMIFNSKYILVEILLERIRIVSRFNVFFDLVRVIVIFAEHSGWMRGKRQFHYVRNQQSGDYAQLRLPPDYVSRYHMLCNSDCAFARPHLLGIIPSWP